MQTAALIVAAGMSSRMGDFKPMLNIGSISIAKRIVANFHQAGISRIVVITGYKAEALEHHLSNEGLIFLRNENYASTDMVDSARIGLAYLQDKCDRILFTPVDIPLFPSDTVTKLMDSGCDLAVPVCDGVKGHPILISSELVPSILADSGEGGLRGALERCPVPLKTVPVEDRGILHDADTPDD
ncbi:MAG: nucleotidyltransferase family protein, partial [Firmicutes bacterium]|nr:nucleotidyltransferase family protein [Bacillota bacterium]